MKQRKKIKCKELRQKRGCKISELNNSYRKRTRERKSKGKNGTE
jgi:hypothetical protein